MMTENYTSGAPHQLLRVLCIFGEYQQILQGMRWSLDQVRVGIIKQTTESIEDLRFGMKIALKLG